MKLRLLIPLFVIGLLAFGAVLAGCGGDEVTGEEGDGQVATEEGEGGSSLNEYFQQLKALSDDTSVQFNAVFEKFPGVFQEPADTRDALAEMDALYDGVFAGFDALDPPDQVRQFQNDFRDGIAAQRQGFRDLASAIADVESASELEQVLEAKLPELDATSSQINAACLALQGIADDNGIVVDLECSEEQ
jgi:hypothetical protein